MTIRLHNRLQDTRQLLVWACGVLEQVRSRDGPCVCHTRAGPIPMRYAATGPPQGTGPPGREDKKQHAWLNEGVSHLKSTKLI